MFDFFKLRRLAVRNHLLGLTLTVAMFPQALTSAQFTLVAETNGLAPSTNLFFGSFDVPSLNFHPVTGKWNLAVDHGGNTLGNGILSFTNSGANFTFYADPTGISLDRPSAQISGLEPAFAVGLPGSASAVRSGNVTLPTTTPSGDPIIFNGRPSADSGNIVYMGISAPLSGITWEIISHDVINNVRTKVLDRNEGGLQDAGSHNSGGFADLSYNGSNLVFRGHGSTPQTNGIFRKQVLRTFSSPFLNVGPLGTIADNNTLIPGGGIAKFAFGTFTTETLPVAHGFQGAAWSYPVSPQNGVFTGTPTGVVRVSPPLNTTFPFNPFYGNVSSGGGGMLMYERTPSGGGARQIYMNLMGRETLCVDKSMITRRTVLDLNMGSQAVIRNSSPFSGNNPYGATLAFHAIQLNPHTINAIYVKNVPQVGINLGGDFEGNILGPVNAGDIHFFGIKHMVGGDTSQPPLEDYLMLAGRNSFGDEFGLSQEIGNGLGVDSGGSDDPFMINDNAGIAEGISISLEYDVNFDTILFRQLDPDESVMIGVDGAMTEFFYAEAGQEQLMEGLQAIELDSLFLPAGSTLNIEYGSGNGFTLESVILQSSLIPSLEGDFDLNGSVDGSDFLAWQRGESPNPLRPSDLADWESSYGNNAPLVGAASSTAVPEPTTAILLLFGVANVFIRNRNGELKFDRS